MKEKSTRRIHQNTLKKSSASKPKKAVVKLGKSKVEVLDEWDREDAKDIYYPPSLLDVLMYGTICLFPGIRKRRLGEADLDFRNCLPLLGNCKVLIYCELNLDRAETKNHVMQQVGTEYEGIKIRMDTPDDLDLPVPERDQLFPRCAESPPDWLPDYAKPLMDRFWGLWSVLEIGIPGHARTLNLLHLGIGGQAVWLTSSHPML